MLPSPHSQSEASLFIFNKKYLKVIVALSLFVSLFIQKPVAEEISFYVPEDHEKYQLIDSLYQLIDTTKQIITQKETGLIKEKDVREDVWEIKKRYLNYLLENNIRDTAAVIGYCTAIQTHFEVKKQYFKELLSALEGDIRAKCFIFWKSAREEYSQISNYMTGLAIEKGSVSTVQYDTVGQQELTLEIKEPSVSDVLGLEELSLEDDDPFQGTESSLAEVERGEVETADSLKKQAGSPKEESKIQENKLNTAALNKSDMLAGLQEEEESNTKIGFQEDILKALSAKKSENEADLEEEDKAEADTDSPEKEAVTDVTAAEKKTAVSTPKPAPAPGGSQKEKAVQATPVKESPKEKATEGKKE